MPYYGKDEKQLVIMLKYVERYVSPNVLVRLPLYGSFLRFLILSSSNFFYSSRWYYIVIPDTSKMIFSSRSSFLGTFCTSSVKVM